MLVDAMEYFEIETLHLREDAGFRLKSKVLPPNRNSTHPSVLSMPDRLAHTSFPSTGWPLYSGRIHSIAICLIVLCVAAVPLQANDAFDSVVRPFLQSHCIECHTGADAEGKLDMTELDSRSSISGRFTDWKSIERRVSDGSMPPKDASSIPNRNERVAFTNLSRELRRNEAIRIAGEPGLVAVRRLSNAEYNNTVRDLTQVDLRPAREFPVDPANEAGFDNSGESLSMSSALLNKYLSAARSISNHMVLTPCQLPVLMQVGDQLEKSGLPRLAL